jgi:uncharacterized membrane protein
MSNKRPKPISTDTREQKKAEFQSTDDAPSTRRHFAALIGVIAILSAAAVYIIWGGSKGESALYRGYQTIVSPGQDVRIPIADVNDGRARFYSYALPDNRKISFFVLKSSDGTIRAAFNACDVCYEARRGYHQEEDEMVCNKCKRHFPSTSVNEVQGGCNPAPLERTVEGDHLLIKARDLQLGALYF